MNDPRTLRELLDLGAEDAEALGAPGRHSLTYGELRQQVDATVEALNQRGIGRGDRVAIVLSNGPEMASAFLSVACGATTAPLNPAYRKQEFDFYLSDLGAKALIVEEDSSSPALDSARELGMSVLRLVCDPERPAGAFDLAGHAAARSERGGGAGPEDVALVLHTSGTTSRPKIVPLLQRNVCASSGNIARTLRLTPEDRCLNVMPLFHIHGLMAPVLASLRAGASVHCTPGFNALRFFAWMDEVRPTWYSAVPTMHQAILSRATGNRPIIERTPLRLIRSSSSSLPPPVMADLERTFGVPVVEAYAMTEASHQMTCNPLPPGARKAGTVGVAAGPEVAVMDPEGCLLEPGEVGEIVIRGPNVTPGYENNPEANAAAFTDGWFRTGDEGIQDEEGYFTLTGRLKEIINRGGEKISPKEVDLVIQDHEAVHQVVTFAVPHPKLGEDVAAAVVLEEGAQVEPAEIRAFAAARLADFKVPRTVLILDEIPKGPTGKLRRIGLAEQLGLTG